MNLFEIEKAILNFEFEIDEETGEILNIEALDNLKMAKETKVENIGLYIKNLNAEAEAVKAEKQAMADRQKALENKANRLKDYLLIATQGEPFSTPRLAISYRKSESVEIDEDANLPDEYVNTEVVTKPDKKALKEAIKGGAKIKGVRVIEKQNIQIK